MDAMGGSVDALLVTARYAPIIFVAVGLGLVMWLSRQRMPHEWRPDVLDALSETEALPSSLIRDRPPLAHQNVDLHTLEQVLDGLCLSGEVVRWYEPISSDSGIPSRRAVYRRIAPTN